MGIWNSDIINGDATLECAMELLTAAGIGPTHWPPKAYYVGTLMAHGLPIVTRLGNFDEYFACLEKAKDHHEALEANIEKLMAICMKTQGIKDRNMHLASGGPVLVGHSFQILALLLMRAGAYFPVNFEVALGPLIVEDDPNFTTQPKNPIRKLIMRGFKKLFDEYAMMSKCMMLHVYGKADYEVHELLNSGMIPGLSDPFDVSGIKHITITRLLYKQPHPEIIADEGVMIWQGDDDDAMWIEKINRKFENVKREPLTRKLPIPGEVLCFGLKPPSPEQLAGAHALHLKETECKYATDEKIEKENGPLAYKAVRIYGLNARPDLNGKLGVATSFDKAKGRYKVVLVGTSPDPRNWPKEQLGVKPGNLVRLETTHDSLFLPEEPPEEPMID